ncbi:hypothetical protein TNCV_1777241 [Trichonephila clavipes]|nr:hypothetical protein TNCV_1777241 [Trichonephila clavipes]
MRGKTLQVWATCYSLNMASVKGVASLNLKIDVIHIDIFYFLEHFRSMYSGHSSLSSQCNRLMTSVMSLSLVLLKTRCVEGLMDVKSVEAQASFYWHGVEVRRGRRQLRNVLKHRQFKEFLKDFDDLPSDIRYCTEVILLSRGVTLKRFMELFNEIVTFLFDCG